MIGVVCLLITGIVLGLYLGLLVHVLRGYRHRRKDT